MSRIAAAGELQAVIEHLQRLTERGERLAESSGGLVDGKWFRGAQAMLMMAAGDLHAKGLVVTPASQAQAQL
jgi:hypothetical protein